ncbi:hypothetical protein PMZ80_001461 [Knufia obscura]|uniref:C2H2-type domain-containing protein n=1 Tax=Knufia obscura TaxID=1635080 RepID=A0ABR0S3B8_9EURO|nr:hypothetical protein PMZ80_001461 [Knufia obscura]
MSYASLSNYYGSSGQKSCSSNAYPSNRSSNNQMYPTSMTGQGNAQQPVSYGSSGYGYSGQPPYATSGGMESSNETYQTGTNYGYQRGSAYDNQDQSLNDAYSQNYYGRNNAAQTQPQSNAEGLSSLAYASGLESANARSNTSRSAQSYGAMSQPSQQQQNRVRSPVDTPSRYSVNPPSSSTSYPMQQQASTSSSSSQQLAVNAAAALAGAVNRRYSNQPQSAAANTSPSMANVRAAAQSFPRRTASPQTANTNSSQQYSSNQQPQQSQSTYSNYNTPSNYQVSTRQSQSTPTNSSSRQSGTNVSQITQHRQPPAPPRRNIQQTGSIANLVTSAQEAESSTYADSEDVQSSAPTFIDPTAIFDPYQRERERKRLEAERAAAEAKQKADEEAKAEAERRKQAEEDASKKKQQEEAEAQKRQAAAKFASTKKRKAPAAAAVAAAPASTEEAMAAEMKAMMEKMKAFQSKDPSLFKKLWSDMRQPGSSASAASVQSPSPQLAQQSLPGMSGAGQPTSTPQPTPQSDEAQEKAASSRRRKSARMGPDGEKLHLNGYPVVVENNPEGLPDMGRFPAERRIRPNKYNKRDKDQAEGPGDGVESTAASPSAPDPASTTAPVSTPASGSKRPRSSKKAQTTPAALAGAFTFSAENGTPTEGATPKQNLGTVWPLEKRNALTSTALRALKANPENANIELSEEDLKKMLENNPSYITLCELLEQRGLKFHRGHFARELLNSVPDLKTPTPAPHSGTPSKTTQSAAAAPVNSQPPQLPPFAQNFSYPPPPGQYGVPPPGYQPQYPPPPQGHFIPAQPPPGPAYGQGVLYPPQQGYAPPSATYKTPKPKHPARPEPPPGSKEAAARKRDFSELIDLTELGDDDNYVVPDKHPRLDGPDSDVEMEDNPIQAFQKQGQPPQMQQYAPPPTGWYAPPPTQPMHFNSQGYSNNVKKQDSFAESKTGRLVLARTLNKNEALKKQYYDPKTVARDILIASGRHPEERPLNVHLAGMLGKYIELESDVSTFEWDEIDPGGPAVPKVELVDIPATRPRFKMGERLPRKQKSRASLIDKTCHPDQEKRALSAPSPISNLKQAAQEQSPSLQSQPARLKKPSGLCHSLLASDEHATPATFDPTRPPPLLSDSRTPASVEKPAMDDTPTQKRRGRPPGSKNKYPSLGGLKNQAALATSGVKINVPVRDPTPSGKDKFKCKWKKCSTVLHNLDTLRKHIGRVHRLGTEDVVSGGYTCWWKKCKFLKQDDNGDWITTKAFDHWEDWLKHIERDHITPIGMNWGDGPSTQHVDPQVIQQDREAYTSNKQKQIVTPLLNDDNAYPADAVHLTEVPDPRLSSHAYTDKQKSEKKDFAAYMKAHNINPISREASKEVLRAMAERKKKIGPGIDRGGCTLINEEMRRLFIQNPGIRRVVALSE